MAGGYSLHRVPLHKVNAYLVKGAGGTILVDAGPKGSEGSILDLMDQLGLKREDLKLLILTHAHYDHAGSAGIIRNLTGCKILVHRSEADRLRKGLTSIPGGTRWKARVLVTLGKPFTRLIAGYPGAEPDLESEAVFALQPFGIPGTILHTPGHTRGSQVVLLENGELISGDTLFGIPGKLHFPPFAENLPALLESWGRIRELPVTRFYPAHGASFSFKRFREEYDEGLDRYRRSG